MSFQITDDILNVTGNSEKMGKAIKTDASRHQVTFPELLGIEAARREAEKWTLQAKKAILFLDDSAWALRELADYILDRQS